MAELQARRTLVKSPPELWAEVSDAESLARHLGEFGEIRITRLEAESTVAWEGERASGTVELAPAGWGTRVTLTARPIESEPKQEAPLRTGRFDRETPAEPAPAAEELPEPALVAVPEPLDPVIATPKLELPDQAAVEAPVELQVAETEPETTPKRGFFSRLVAHLRPVPDLPEDDQPQKPSAPRPVPPPEEPPPLAPAAVVEPVVEASIAPDPVPEPTTPEAEPEAPSADEHSLAVLTATLDSLGAAHHRPFSRG
jgi:hypothetical protein